MNPRFSRRRAATLATVLFFLSVAAILTTIFATRFIVRLRFSRQLECRSQALLLADSGIATAIAEYRKDPSFGTHDEALNVTIALPDDPGAHFFLRFGPSVNNIRGDAPIGECPQGMMLLDCSGYYRGVTARKLCWVAAPPFPYALASSGPIRSSGGLTMGAVPAGFDPSQGLDVSKLERAEMMTQGRDDASGAALVLRGESTLVGTARSAGSVDLADTVEVRGEVVANSTAESVPRIPLSELAPEGEVFAIRSSNFGQLEKVAGQLEYSGAQLHYQQGLELQGATLRVRGNLVIDGPLTGIGALIVDGNVTIRGGGGLSADNQAAIIAGGGISVVGSSQESSYFQGLLYAQGAEGVKLQDTTVVGTVLNAGESSPGVGAPMQVDRARVAFDARAVSQEVELSANLSPSGSEARDIRLKRPLPLSSFYRDGAWDIPPNVRPAPSPSDPDPLSPLEQFLLPYLELRVNGRWYASREEALAAGARPSSVRMAVGLAGQIYAAQLDELRPLTPGENHRLTFQLDLNRYLQAAGRLRLVRLQTL